MLQNATDPLRFFLRKVAAWAEEGKEGNLQESGKGSAAFRSMYRGGTYRLNAQWFGSQREATSNRNEFSAIRGDEPDTLRHNAP